MAGQFAVAGALILATIARRAYRLKIGTSMATRSSVLASPSPWNSTPSRPMTSLRQVHGCPRQRSAPADLATVRDLVAGAGLPLAGLADAALVLVADAGGQVVGAVALDRHGAGDDTAYLLRSAAVDPAWQGRGVGAALTAAALSRVDDTGAAVGLLTETASEYFPRFGFTPAAREVLPAALAGSAELRGACPASAHALLRPAVNTPRGGDLP